jgi:NAD(P)H-hydrate epimerase
LLVAAGGGLMREQEIKSFALKLKRNPESHKYNYGHVLVIAGSKYMPGAGVLCCNAVLRSGAGLVTYAVNDNFLSAACSMSNPETLFFSYKNSKDILSYIAKKKVSAIAAGPGLVESVKTKDFIFDIISNVNLPVILDASALSSFALKFKKLKNVKADLIITPHEGEFSKLTGLSILQIKDNALNLAENFAKENNVILVLKKHKTIVTDYKQKYINDSGSAAMATAGSGDVLSGIIAALCANSQIVSIESNKENNENKDLFEAVKFAVWIHGLAGQRAQKDKGNCIIASDIIESIPYILRRLE